MRVQLLVSDIIVAYTYLLTHKITKQYYYGVRHSGIGENCTPEDDLGINYFTSSSRVKELINQYGPDSFKYEIRRTFTSIRDARIWEHKVLRRMNVIHKQNWLNQSCGKLIDRASCQKGARVAHITQKQNGHYDVMSKKGVAIKQQKILMGECVHGGKPVGFKDALKTRRLKSKSQSGNKNSQYGTRWIKNLTTQTNKKISVNDVIPAGWEPGRITTKPYKKPVIK